MYNDANTRTNESFSRQDLLIGLFFTESEWHVRADVEHDLKVDPVCVNGVRAIVVVGCVKFSRVILEPFQFDFLS